MSRFIVWISVLLLAIPSAAQAADTKMSISEPMSLSSEDVKQVRGIAKEFGSWEIAEIYCGELMSPAGPKGVRVSYVPEIVGNHAIVRSLDIRCTDWPYESAPPKGRRFFSKWVVAREGVRSRVERIFKIDGQTVQASLDDAISYADGERLLKELAKTSIKGKAGKAEKARLGLVSGIWRETGKDEPSLYIVSVETGAHSWRHFQFVLKAGRFVFRDTRDMVS